MSSEPTEKKKKSAKANLQKLKKLSQRGKTRSTVKQKTPLPESVLPTETNPTINVDSSPHVFMGIPEDDWKDVGMDEVRDMTIPELQSVTLDDNQKYLIVRMLASSKPMTLRQMHEILTDVNPALDYPERHFKINQLRLEQVVRLVDMKLGGEYVFEPRRN